MDETAMNRLIDEQKKNSAEFEGKQRKISKRVEDTVIELAEANEKLVNHMSQVEIKDFKENI